MQGDVLNLFARRAGALWPLWGRYARGAAPLRSSKWGPEAPTAPMGRALRPSTPGDFPVAGKVTKGAPRAAPFGIPRCVVAALFALAALRSVSRRATFCHKNRPICHFGVVGKSVLFSSSSSTGVTPSIFNPWLGRDAPEDAAGSILPQPIPLGQGAGESKGVRPLVPGVQGPGGPWRIFAYFLYARK